MLMFRIVGRLVEAQAHDSASLLLVKELELVAPLFAVLNFKSKTIRRPCYAQPADLSCGSR